MFGSRAFGLASMVGRLGAALPGTPRTHAVAQALVVTFLWSSSYVLIRIGLEDIPALTFAGLRYGLAALVLLPPFVARGHHRAVVAAGRREVALLCALGVSLYAVTQGAQFVALDRVRAATVSLGLTATPVVVALVGAVALDERPTARQWAGMALLVAGALLYFAPLGAAGAKLLGFAVVGVALLGNAAGAVLGRRLNTGGLDPLAVTLPSMGLGAALLLATGAAVQGVPALSLANWAIVAWLAVVNTAAAFTLWNHTLRTLTAVESSVVNNTMLLQIAVLGWLFLGEPLAPTDWVGLALVGAGALAVQLRR